MEELVIYNPGHIKTAKMGEGDHKPQVYQAENVVDKPKRRGCVGHCVKFWWAYLIGLIVIVVIVVPVM